MRLFRFIPGLGQVYLNQRMKVVSLMSWRGRAFELERQSLRVERQVTLPIRYGEIRLDAGYRLDLLVAGQVIVELKAVEKLMPLHDA